MTGSAKDVQSFFERVAKDWDTMRLDYYDERVIERMIGVSGLHGEMRVSDVGTGTGFVAAGLAPQVKRVVAGLINRIGQVRDPRSVQNGAKKPYFLPFCATKAPDREAL